MTKRAKWAVTVKKHYESYVTQFTVGVQTFTIVRCSIERDGRREARARAVFYQRMFLIALRNMGVNVPERMLPPEKNHV